MCIAALVAVWCFGVVSVIGVVEGAGDDTSRDSPCQYRKSQSLVIDYIGNPTVL